MGEPWYEGIYVECVNGIGGVFLRARDPIALAAWYGDKQVMVNGRFAWATDPEGNRFELWQPPEGE